MSKKTISINPNFLKLSNSGSTLKKKERKQKKVKPNKTLVRPNKLKKQLINRIKEHKKKEEENINVDKNIIDFSNDFDSSLDYLQKLSNKQKKKQRKNNTLKNIDHNISLELPNELVENNKNIIKHINPSNDDRINNKVTNSDSKVPPYGCLKNGKKPTFRQWKQQTQKKANFSTSTSNIENNKESKNMKSKNMKSKNIINSRNEITSEPVINLNNNSSIDSKINLNETNVDTNKNYRETILKKIKQERKTINNKENIKNDLNQKKSNKYRKKIKTFKYKLGKHNNKSVSVLIKNNYTRKKIQHEEKLLKKHSLIDIKKYLRKKNLIKSGSSAPEEVLRAIYEKSILAGDINNNAKDNFIHNYTSN